MKLPVTCECDRHVADEIIDLLLADSEPAWYAIERIQQHYKLPPLK